MRATLVLSVIGLAACDVPAVMFQCSNDSQCGFPGRCVGETKGCAFPSADCSSGYRYDSSAGPLGGQCASDGTAADLSSDPPDLGSPPDLSPPLSWTTFPLAGGDRVWSVWGADAGHAWAVGDNGVIWYSTDRGVSWARAPIVEVGVVRGLRGIWGASLTDIYSVGLDGWIFHSNNVGASWSTVRMTPVGSPPLNNLYGVWGWNGNDVYVGQDSAPVLKGSGSNWNAQPAPTGGTGCSVDFCGAIWGSGPDDVYAVGDGAQHWNGVGWYNLSLPGDVGVRYGVWGTSSSDVFIVGSGASTQIGTLWHTTDGGTSWKVVTLPFGSSILHGITGTGPNDIYVGAADGRVFHSVDDGVTWGVTVTVAPQIDSIWAIDGSNVIAAGKNQILWLK